MERLLQDIYGDEHEALLPKLVRVDIPYPGMRPRKFPAKDLSDSTSGVH